MAVAIKSRYCSQELFLIQDPPSVVISAILASRILTASETPKTINVLVVEDQEDDYIYLERILRKAVFARYELVWCATYEAGLAALAEKKHDVALFDYNLGSGTGLDLLRE